MSSKILVVEDNEKSRLLIKDILLHYGYEVIESGDGETGLRLAREHRPALVLMDIQMPVMDGMSATKIIKNDPETKGIRIIAITSFAMKDDKERFLKAGFDDYIAKPVDTRKLMELVRRYVSTSK